MFLFACLSLIALLLFPSVATALCSYPEYSQCGTPLSPVTFTITQVNYPFAYIQADWYGYSANFTDNIYVHDLTTGATGPMSSYNNQENPPYGTPTQLVYDPLGQQFHLGDQVEFVIHVANDPNHPGGVDYCEGLGTCYKDRDNNNNPLGHVFAENLPPANCDQQVDCVFLGFKDLPFKEGNNQNYHNDWDYNDFEVMVYGVSINGSQSVVTPEPSSIILLAGVPLAFVVRKLRILI
jgi:hypothetical protein